MTRFRGRDFVGRKGPQCALRAQLGKHDRIEQIQMLVLHTQHRVGLTFADRFGYLRLSAHRVNGYDRPLERQGLEQLGNGGDLVGRLLGGLLP